jgi:hypothetical protein
MNIICFCCNECRCQDNHRCDKYIHTKIDSIIDIIENINDLMKNYYWLHIRACDHKNHIFNEIKEIKKISEFRCFFQQGQNLAYLINLKYEFGVLNVQGSYSCHEEKNNLHDSVYCRDLYYNKIQLHDLINNIRDGTAITFNISTGYITNKNTHIKKYYSVFDEEYNENAIEYFKRFLPSSYELKSAVPLNTEYENVARDDKFYDFYKDLFVLRERLLTKPAK